MDSGATFLGLLGPALVLVAAATRIGRGGWRVGFALGALVVALLPAGGLPIAAYLRGVTGDLSVTMLIVLSLGVVSSLRDTALPQGLVPVFVGAAASGAFLYPLALGLGPFDPYGLGFEPRGLLAAAGLLALVAWWRGMTLLLTCLVAAVAAHAVRLLASDNLWDYWIDPWLLVLAIYEIRRFRRIT